MNTSTLTVLKARPAVRWVVLLLWLGAPLSMAMAWGWCGVANYAMVLGAIRIVMVAYRVLRSFK